MPSTPRAAGAAGPTPPVAPSLPYPAGMTAAAGPCLLIVEDDEGIGAGLLRAVRGEGYTATWCRTATEAQQQSIDQVDLILLDLGSRTSTGSISVAGSGPSCRTRRS